MTHFLIAFTLLFTLTCKAATTAQALEPTAIKNHPNLESTFTDFSAALRQKNLALLLTITAPKALYLVRQFTSGNLGGRGEPLSQTFSPGNIDKNLAIAVKKQIPFALPQLFRGLPTTSFAALEHHSLTAEIDSAHYDQWAPILRKSLAGAAAAEQGDPVILSSSSGKYWIYAEAQIIDEILVGSFAVFSPEAGKLKLVAVIDLL